MTPKFDNLESASLSAGRQEDLSNTPDSDSKTGGVEDLGENKEEVGKKEPTISSDEALKGEDQESLEQPNEKLVYRLKKAQTIEDAAAITETVPEVVMADGSRKTGKAAAVLVLKGEYHQFTEEVMEILGYIGRQEYWTRQEKGAIERRSLAWKVGDKFRSRRTGAEFEIIDLDHQGYNTPYHGYATLKFANPDPEKFGRRQYATEQVSFKKLNRMLDDIEPVKLSGRELEGTGGVAEQDEEWLGQYEPPAPSDTSVPSEVSAVNESSGWRAKFKRWFGR